MTLLCLWTSHDIHRLLINLCPIPADHLWHTKGMNDLDADCISEQTRHTIKIHRFEIEIPIRHAESGYETPSLSTTSL